MIRNRIRKQISLEAFAATGESPDEWPQSQEGQRYLTEDEILKVKEEKFRAQARRLEANQGADGTLAQRRSYLELFLSNPRGLGVVKGAGERNSSDQTRFRADLIMSYNATNPNPGWEDTLWCPILSKWFSASTITASHIFSYKHGQQTMSAIFGTEHPELFHPKNGILIHNQVEEKFETGLFAIVPDIQDNPTAEQVVQWQEQEPKEYKLKIIDRDPAKLNRIIPELGETRWMDLDGKKLDFRSEFRPRARYLYWNFCLQILRLAFRERHKGSVLREQELGKQFWVSPGKYVKKNMLLAFVEEVGHKYDDLLQGADDDSDSEVEEGDDLMLLAATREIDLSQGDRRVEGEEQGSDAEEDDYVEESDYDEEMVNS